MCLIDPEFFGLLMLITHNTIVTQCYSDYVQDKENNAPFTGDTSGNVYT